MLADLAVLDRDYFSVDEEEIKNIEAVLTIVGGRIVYAKDEFASFSPAPIPVLPEWSPVVANATGAAAVATSVHCCAGSCHVHGHDHNRARLSRVPVSDFTAFWGALGCSCFAF
jgi:hypothetical protein